MADYYQTVSTIQTTFCKPLVRKCLSLLSESKQVTLPEFYSIEFNQLYKRTFREEAADVAGETLALELDKILKDPSTPQEVKLAFIKLMMLPGSLRE
jgi:hypothetical protein